MRRKTTMKVARGRLEEDRRKSEDAFEYQRVMLFILPLLMIAILVVGVYFGYLSYQDDFVDTKEFEQSKMLSSQFTEDEEDVLLKVVSSAKPVDKSYVPDLVEVNGVKVNTLMEKDLNAMLIDAASVGLDLTLESGLLVKFSDGTKEKFSQTDEFFWLQKNCVNYGFVLRYPEKENTGGLSYSPDLYRYVGKEYALLMRSYNMNLDEFVQYINCQ